MIKFHKIKKDDYESQQYILIRNIEESGVEKVSAYLDSNGIPTIGVGMNLRTHYKIIAEKILSNYSLTDSEQKESFINDIKIEVDKSYPIPKEGGPTQSEVNAQVQKNLDDVMVKYCGTGSKFSFSSVVDEEGQNVQLRGQSSCLKY